MMMMFPAEVYLVTSGLLYGSHILTYLCQNLPGLTTKQKQNKSQIWKTYFYIINKCSFTSKVNQEKQKDGSDWWINSKQAQYSFALGLAHITQRCCCTVIWAAQPGSCIVNGNSKMCARCHLSPQQPDSSVTTTGSSCYPQGPVKAFLFCHFIGNGKAISYTRNIWRAWTRISTYAGNSQWQWRFSSTNRRHCVSAVKI